MIRYLDRSLQGGVVTAVRFDNPRHDTGEPDDLGTERDGGGIIEFDGLPCDGTDTATVADIYKRPFGIELRVWT